MLYLVKQVKQLHTLSFQPPLCSEPSAWPHEGERAAVHTGWKRASFRQEGNWIHALVQVTCIAQLLNFLHHIPPSDAPSDSFPLFLLFNRDKVCIVLHVIFGWRSQKSVTERNFHYLSLNLQWQWHVVEKHSPSCSTGKAHCHFFEIFLQYFYSSHSTVLHSWFLLSYAEPFILECNFFVNSKTNPPETVMCTFI